MVDGGASLALMNLRKTKMCLHFAAGRCRAGAACGFAHRPEELQTRVDLAKTSLCKAFLRGQCPHASKDCAFAHGRRDMRRVMPEEPKMGRRARREQARGPAGADAAATAAAEAGAGAGGPGPVYLWRTSDDEVVIWESLSL